MINHIKLGVCNMRKKTLMSLLILSMLFSTSNCKKTEKVFDDRFVGATNLYYNADENKNSLKAIDVDIINKEMELNIHTLYSFSFQNTENVEVKLNEEYFSNVQIYTSSERKTDKKVSFLVKGKAFRNENIEFIIDNSSYVINVSSSEGVEVVPKKYIYIFDNVSFERPYSYFVYNIDDNSVYSGFEKIFTRLMPNYKIVGGEVIEYNLYLPYTIFDTPIPEISADYYDGMIEILSLNKGTKINLTYDDGKLISSDKEYEFVHTTILKHTYLDNDGLRHEVESLGNGTSLKGYINELKPQYVFGLYLDD